MEHILFPKKSIVLSDDKYRSLQEHSTRMELWGFDAGENIDSYEKAVRT